jgi:hypothetical protein
MTGGLPLEKRLYAVNDALGAILSIWLAIVADIATLLAFRRLFAA